MSDIPGFPYSLLWGERACARSRTSHAAMGEFLRLANTIPLAVHAEPFSLADANHALARLRSGTLTGAAVLTTGT